MLILLYGWFCEGGEDALHRFLLLRLQSGEKGSEECFLIVVQIPAGEVPSVHGADAPAPPCAVTMG